MSAPDYSQTVTPKQRERLLTPYRRLERARRQVLSERLDPAEVDEIMAAANKEYEALLPEIGNKKGILESALAGTFPYLAYAKVLQRRGWSDEEIGWFFQATYEAAIQRVPRFLARIVFRIATPFLKRRLAREAEASREDESEGAWRFDYVQKTDGTFGIDVHRCAVCSVFERHDAAHLVPYLCAMDDQMSELLDMGLKRRGTRALGSKCCDFRYRAGGEPQTLRSQHSLPILPPQS